MNVTLQNDRRGMWWMVVGRAIAVPVLLAHGGPWRTEATWEGICGVWLLVLLIGGSETRKRRRRRAKVSRYREEWN
jgi:hypothetical protein